MFYMSHCREITSLEQPSHLGRLKHVYGFDDGQVFRVFICTGTGLVVSFATTADIPTPADRFN